MPAGHAHGRTAAMKAVFKAFRMVRFIARPRCSLLELDIRQGSTLVEAGLRWAVGAELHEEPLAGTVWIVHLGVRDHGESADVGLFGDGSGFAGREAYRWIRRAWHTS